MSTQSIKEINFHSLNEGVSKALVCIGNRFILEGKFGIKNKISNRDIASLVYYKKLLDSRYCEQDITPEIIFNINKLVAKYN